MTVGAPPRAIAGRLGQLRGWVQLFTQLTEDWADRERHQAPLWIPVALGLGICAWFLLPARTDWLACALAGLALTLAMAGRRARAAQWLFWGGLLVAAGVGVAWLRADMVAAPRLDRPTSLSFAATVVGLEDRAAEGRWRLLLAPQAETLPPRIRLTLRTAPAADIRPGARVSLRARLQPPAGPAYPGGYDFARRAWFEGIGATGYPLGPIALLAPAPPPASPEAWLDAVRRSLTQSLREGVGGGAAGGMAAALVTGDRGGIDAETEQAMRDSGLAHLLSISGLHIAVVVGAALIATRRLLLLSPWIGRHWDTRAVAALVAALAGIAYTLLAGASVPTVRSCIAALAVLAGMLIGRDAISLRMVALAATLILLLRPEALLGASFQLSFAAVTGLVAFYETRLGQRLLRRGDGDGIWMRLGLGLSALLLSGLVAEAVLAPTALYHFNRAGFYGMLANLVAIPLTSFVLLPLLALAIVAMPLGLAALPFVALREAFGLLIALAHATAALPGAVLRLPQIPTLAYALVILGGLWLLLWRSRARHLGWLALLPGLAGMALARPADIYVTGDGRHIAVAGGKTLLTLRARAGDYVADMLGDASGRSRVERLPEGRTARSWCSRDACSVAITRGGRRWQLLATRSDILIARAIFEPACANADIIVSDRRLPRWCRARWLTLDRDRLRASGAVAIDLTRGSVRSVAALAGEHPWAPDQ